MTPSKIVGSVFQAFKLHRKDYQSNSRGLLILLRHSTTENIGSRVSTGRWRWERTYGNRNN